MGKPSGYSVPALTGWHNQTLFVERLLLQLGFDTCGRLRQPPKLTETPVIFIIELSEPQVGAGAFAAGGMSSSPNPFQYQEVLARVRLHLRHHALEFELDRLYRQFDKRLTTQDLRSSLARRRPGRSNRQARRSFGVDSQHAIDLRGAKIDLATLRATENHSHATTIQMQFPESGCDAAGVTSDPHAGGIAGEEPGQRSTGCVSIQSR